MTASSLAEKIESREAVVAVLGLGYVGLPLVLSFAEEGFPTLGLDVAEDRVEGLRRGQSHVDDIPDADVQKAVASRQLEVSADFDLLQRADAIIMCVPTPLSKSGDPDISYIVSATLEVARRLTPGQLVILESTTYPGTTMEVVLPRLESNGRKVGEDFFLAFSPERIDPGNPDFNVRNTAKVVGGVTEACRQAACSLYAQVLEQVVPVSSATTAEMVKILENTFRAVNIGLVNEVAMMCDPLGIDVWEVIDAAATKPFGYLPFYPGPGLGGHCIPIDPFYLSWKMRTLDSRARFIELAGDVNSGMPEFVVQKVVDGLNDASKAVRGSKVLLAGVAYKSNVSDVRESPAFDIASGLYERGAELSYHDPHVPAMKVDWGTMESVALLAPMLEDCDCVVVVTNHDNLDLDQILQHAPLVVDTRNATRGKQARARIIKL
jgi:UDP-N-acetyl-D-glucosamine dehydrogenase